MLGRTTAEAVKNPSTGKVLLKGGELIVVQVTPDVVQMVVGLEPVAIQWEDGFKFMTIMVPQIRADQNGNCGVTVLKA